MAETKEDDEISLLTEETWSTVEKDSENEMADFIVDPTDQILKLPKILHYFLNK